MKDFLKWIILIAAFIVSCKTQTVKEDARVISMSIPPQKYFASAIAGERYEYNIMIPPGAGHSSYDPSPRQLSSLSASALYLQMGRLGFELAWMDQLKSVNPDMKVVDISEGLKYIEGEHHHHHEGEPCDESGADPHVWISPSYACTIAANTFKALLNAFPSDSSLFKENYQLLLKEISQVDSAWKSHAPQLKGKTFLIYHPALSYLAQEYGMEQLALEEDGKEPSPETLRTMVKTAREKNIRFIFIQEQYSTDNAKAIARETGAEIVSINPHSEYWKTEMMGILNILTSK